MFLKFSVDLIVRFWRSSNSISVAFIWAFSFVISSSSYSLISAFNIVNISSHIRSCCLSIFLMSLAFWRPILRAFLAVSSTLDIRPISSLWLFVILSSRPQILWLVSSSMSLSSSNCWLAFPPDVIVCSCYFAIFTLFFQIRYFYECTTRKSVPRSSILNIQMSTHCAVSNCTNGQYKLKKWENKTCKLKNVPQYSKECSCEPPVW